MTTKAAFKIEAKNWDEKSFSEVEGQPKLAQANAKNVYEGDIEGEGTLTYLLTYLETECPFIGYEQVTARIGGRSGSFVLQHTGTYNYAENAARGNYTIVPGSATGELKGIRGQGGYFGYHNQPVEYTLDYDFE